MIIVKKDQIKDKRVGLQVHKNATYENRGKSSQRFIKKKIMSKAEAAFRNRRASRWGQKRIERLSSCPDRPSSSFDGGAKILLAAAAVEL